MDFQFSGVHVHFTMRDADLFEKCGYTATISPYQPGDTFVVVSKSFNQAIPDSELLYELYSYADALCNFIVHVNPDTGEVIETVRVPNSSAEVQSDLKLLERSSWTAEDIEVFKKLAIEVERLIAENADDEWAQKQAVYPLLLDAGGSESRYTLPAMSPDEATTAAREALMAYLGLTEEAFDAIYSRLEIDTYDQDVYTFYAFTRMDAPKEGLAFDYCFDFNVRTGEIENISIAEGNG